MRLLRPCGRRRGGHPPPRWSSPKHPKNGQNAEVLYRGIAARAFERVFRLADFVEVTSAVLENGLLHIDLVRELPEAMKPRTIQMNTGNGAESKRVDTKVAA